MIVDYVAAVGKDIRWHGRAQNEAAHYCVNCEVRMIIIFMNSGINIRFFLQLEVFNILFVKEVDKKHVVHCIDCARRLSETLEDFVILEEYARNELVETYDNFVLHASNVTS